MYIIYPMAGILFISIIIFLIFALFIRRFQFHERQECVWSVHLFKTISMWFFVLAVATILTFLGSRLIGEPQSMLFLCREFLEAWAFVWLVLTFHVGAYLTGCLFIPICALWKEAREPNGGAVYLASFKGLSVFTISGWKLPRLGLPPFTIKRFSQTCVYTLLFVFASLWLKTNFISYVNALGMAGMAGHYIAESETNKGNFQYRELVSKSLFDPVSDKEDWHPSTEHWYREFGFGHYLMQSEFVKGYNLKVEKVLRARGEETSEITTGQSGR